MPTKMKQFETIYRKQLRASMQTDPQLYPTGKTADELADATIADMHLFGGVGNKNVNAGDAFRRTAHTLGIPNTKGHWDNWFKEEEEINE